jgi:hypothetical protein
METAAAAGHLHARIAAVQAERDAARVKADRLRPDRVRAG